MACLLLSQSLERVPKVFQLKGGFTCQDVKERRGHTNQLWWHLV